MPIEKNNGVRRKWKSAPEKNVNTSNEKQGNVGNATGQKKREEEK